MDSRLPLSPGVRRFLLTSGAFAFVGAFLVDLSELAKAPDPFGTPGIWLPCLVTGPLSGLAVLETPWSPSLGKRVTAVVTVSLALTVWGLSQPLGHTLLSGLELCGLLLLTVRTTTRRGKATTAAVYTLPLVIATLLLPLRVQQWPQLVAGAYLMTVVVTVAVSIGCTIRALESRKERTAREVRQAERLSLARDLHDLIAHHMTGIIVQANAALTIHAAAPAKVEPILRNIVDSGTETLEATRRLVRVLRENDHGTMRPGDLLTELAELVAAHSVACAGGDGTARLEATAAARTAHLAPEVEISVLRLVQEALTNVRRHAPGARTVVHLDAEPAWVRVTVTNTPSAHSAAKPIGGHGGYGLTGLRERVEALDGTLHTGPLPGGGWQVQAALPLAAPAAT